MMKFEERCPHCGVPVVTRSRRRYMYCRSCRRLAIRWAEKRSRTKKTTGVDIGSFSECPRVLKFVPKTEWQARKRRRYA